MCNSLRRIAAVGTACLSGLAATLPAVSRGRGRLIPYPPAGFEPGRVLSDR